MVFRKAEPSDVPAIAALFDAARQSMRALGIDQWQKGVPGWANAASDAAVGIGRVAEENGEICATYSFLSCGEPDYDEITEGAWLTENGHYAAIHRVTIRETYRGSGLSRMMVQQMVEEAQKGGFLSLRIDTHPGNLPMRRMLEKNGFRYCGIIHLHTGPDAGARRVAYERLLLCDTGTMCEQRGKMSDENL